MSRVHEFISSITQINWPNWNPTKIWWNLVRSLVSFPSDPVKSLQIWWVFHRIWQVLANLLRDLVRFDEISTGFSKISLDFHCFLSKLRLSPPLSISTVATSIDFDCRHLYRFRLKPIQPMEQQTQSDPLKLSVGNKPFVLPLTRIRSSSSIA